VADRSSARRDLALALALPVGVFGVSLAMLLSASRATTPAFDEVARLGAVEGATELVKNVARSGLSELATPGARALLDGKLAPMVLLGAWAKLSLGRLGFIDPLTALRLPWLVLGALAPAAVFVALRPSRGVVTALLGAVTLLLLPRWIHGVVALREGAVLAATASLVVAFYVRSLGPARAGGPHSRSEKATVLWAVTGALVFGVGCALSLATLWLLLPMCLHYALSRSRSTRRLLSRGRLPIPALVLFALPLAPRALFALTPQLWRSSPALVARFFLAPLAPTMVPAQYAGRLVERLPVPGGFATSWLVSTLPVVVTLATLVGVAALLHQLLARRFASGALRPPRDRHAVGSLAVLALGGALLGPALAPTVLVTFPPRVEVALPFVAMLAAIGLHRAATLPKKTIVGVGLTAAAVLSLVPAAVSFGTAGAAFSPLLGGAGRIAASRALPLGDGSELGPLLSHIDRAGGGALSTPGDVPAELWRVLHDTRRLRSSVTPNAGGSGLALVRGAAPQSTAIAEVKRDGAVLWSLVQR